MSPDPAAEADIRRWAEILLENGVVEIRAFDVPMKYGAPGTCAGWFDREHINDLVTAVRVLDGRGGPGVFATVNPPLPGTLALVNNRIQDRVRKTTSDKEIERRRMLFVEIDPERNPKGICATDEEKALAARVADGVESFLRERGWPQGARIDSGNGTYLFYAIDEAPEDHKLIENALKALHQRFGNEHVKVDTTAANPSRIGRIPGTWNRKGDSTAQRPHRLARIVRDPGRLSVVSHELLVALAEELEPEAVRDPGVVRIPPSSDSGGSFDVPAFLARHNIQVVRDGPCDSAGFQGGRKWLLACCPFDPTHTDRCAVVMQGPDGKLGFCCQHNSCKDRTWRDFRKVVDPEYGRQREASRVANPAAGDRAVEQKSKPPPPRLDLDAALPPWLASDCRAIAAWLQLAVEVVVTCVLAYACTAIGNSIWVRARGLELPLSLHFITSLASGSGKSEVRKFLRKCIAQIEREIDQRREEAKLQAEEYADALAAWRSDRKGSAKRRAEAGERPQPPPPDPRGGPRTTYVLSEGTLDGVVATAGDTPRGILWATDEAPEILGMLGAYGDSEGRRALDAARLRKLTEGQPVEAHRAKSNVDPIRRVHRPFLAMDADVQPGVLMGLFSEEDLPSGTVARLSIHEPPSMLGHRQYVTPPPVPGPDVRKRLEDLFLGLWHLPLALDEDGRGIPQPKFLELSPEAEALWAEELELLEGEYASAGTAMVGILGHLRGRLLRKAANLALIREVSTERVEERDMARAIVIGRYFRAHQERFWEPNRPAAEAPQPEGAGEVIKFIRTNEGSTRRDVVAGVRRFRGEGGAKRAGEALDALCGPDGPLRREVGPRTVKYYLAGAEAASAVSGSTPDGPENADTAGADTLGVPVVREQAAPETADLQPGPDPERDAIQGEAKDAADADLERLLREAEDAKASGNLDGEEVRSW